MRRPGSSRPCGCRSRLIAAAILAASGGAAAVAAPVDQPSPPLADAGAAASRRADAADPVLALDNARGSPDRFATLVRGAVERHPAVNEVRAREEEADAGRREARAALFPRLEAAVTRTTPLLRTFQSGLGTVYEQTRAQSRADATLNVDQLLFDFGASARRLRAAGARENAAVHDIDAATNDFVIRAVQVTSEIVSYRALITLMDSFIAAQAQLRGGVAEQIAGGTAASGDLAQVDALLAAARSRQVGYRRALAAAEASFQEVYGVAPPADLELPALPAAAESREAAIAAALRTPAVLRAEALAGAARFEARAAQADRLPRLSAGLGAGAYRVFDDGENHDARALVSVVQRFGGLGARAAGADSRAVQAGFALEQAKRDAVRDAQTAWSDAAVLQDQLAAARASYVASRDARDVLLERFRFTRGSLFNLLTASDTTIAAASDYVLAAAQARTARYALLARTGRLLDSLAIPTPRSARLR